MTIWIVTTGSNDIQLKSARQWNHLLGKVRKELNNLKFLEPKAADGEEYAKAPARVLGIMYGEKPEYYEDLAFPLLDKFSEKLEKERVKPTKIILLLTDQSAIFSPIDKQLMECPYWQDSSKLKPLLEKYLTEKFPKAEQVYLTLEPKGDKGLEHWNDTLKLVQEALWGLEINKTPDIYVSHQAGTPAISSAVQFVTLGRFGKQVQFLVGNEYMQSEAEIIDSSAYLRGIQVQQAKGLIRESAPGSARKLLEKIEGIDERAIAQLDKMIDIFNLNRPRGDSDRELEIEAASGRILDALELVGIFFNQKNYLQGITLLVAAQETFLKVAILSKVRKIKDTIDLNGRQVEVSSLVTWTRQGLMLNQEAISALPEARNKLKFPDKFKFEEASTENLEIGASWMFTWIGNLEPKFTAWKLLKWWGKIKYQTNQHEEDIRNQLLHNLCGVEEKDVVKYLLGNEEGETTAIAAYTDKVKDPFLKAIELFELPGKRDKLYKNLQAIADSIN